jgi:RNA polymerase sigma-70 factor (ECF subfamily)
MELIRQAAAPRLIMGLGEKIAESAADFEELVTFYRPRIFRFALASLRDRDAAETITQDCFLNAYRSRDRFRSDCSVQTWLMQIAVNLIRDYARNRRLQFWKRTRNSQPLEELASRTVDRDPSAEKRMLLNEQVKAIWNAASTLPERQRTVFLLRFVEDMDLLEIAAVTGMKEGTVKTHLFRSLRTVRERIGANI